MRIPEYGSRIQIHQNQMNTRIHIRFQIGIPDWCHRFAMYFAKCSSDSFVLFLMAIEWALLFVKAINIFSTNYLMFSILNMFQAAGGLGMHTVQHHNSFIHFYFLLKYSVVFLILCILYLSLSFFLFQ